MEFYQVVLGIYVVSCAIILGSAIAEYVNEKINNKL